MRRCGSLPTAEPTLVQWIVANLCVRQAPFLPELLLVRGWRVDLPSAWFTRCAGSTGPVAFRFILLCLCLPVSMGRIGGCRNEPVPGNLSRGLPFRRPGRFHRPTSNFPAKVVDNFQMMHVPSLLRRQCNQFKWQFQRFGCHLRI
jgi:hypothetical protein